MKAGELKHSITVQSKSVATGDRGQAVPTWSTLAVVPAKIEPLAGRKLEIARQLVPTASHEITIRYLPAINAQCRIVYAGRIFNVGNINSVLELNFTQVITCIEQSGVAAQFYYDGTGRIIV